MITSRYPAFAATCAPGERRQSGPTVITCAVVGSQGVEMSRAHGVLGTCRLHDSEFGGNLLGIPVAWINCARRPGTCPSMVRTTGHVPRCGGPARDMPLVGRGRWTWWHYVQSSLPELDMSPVAAYRHGTCPSLVVAVGQSGIMSSPRCRSWTCPPLPRAGPGQALPWSARLDMSPVAAGRPGTCPSLVVAVGHSGIMSSPRCRGWACPRADKQRKPG